MTKQYIFIIGTGRTGTLFLERFFNDHAKDCYAVQEPSHRIKLLSNLYLSGKLPESKLRRHLASYKNKVDRKLRHIDKQVYIQVDAWLIGFAGLLENTFSSPFVIHLVRDPLTYIPSISNRYYKETIKGFLRDVIPYWKLRGNKTGHYSTEEWIKLSNEEKMAWQWKVHNAFIEEHKPGMKNYLLIRYEDLFSEGNSGLKSMVDFCHLELDEDAFYHIGQEEKINTARKQFPASQAWPPEVKSKVIEICQPLMGKYGYAV